ncbi:AraC family transcriptional regulator [Rhodobacteraceae bacterium NNCM2]|nr:AraC family transcriptional regulator [Coraliihabitans acroporae]
MGTVPPTRFAPKLAAGVDPARHYPVLSSTALVGVPAFVRATFGSRVLARANHETMFDLELVTEEDCFIPHAVMWRFVSSVERLAGQEDFGLLVAPHLSLENYGSWGQYILGAETLREAIERGIRTIRYHSIGDRFAMAEGEETARISYASAAKGKPGYRHVACGIIGVVLSICRAYLPRRWRPVSVEFDLPRPARTTHFEETFGCPVLFDMPAPAVVVEVERLSARRRARQPRQMLTVDDLAKSRSAIYSADLATIVAEQVRIQLLSGEISIERTAHALDMSVRSVQRELNQCGVRYRDIAGEVRLVRGAGLLRDTGLSVTQISAELGYSAPAHFARAFRKQTGLSPVDYRKSQCGAARKR